MKIGFYGNLNENIAKQIIKVLEMLGGINRNDYIANDPTKIYFNDTEYFLVGEEKDIPVINVVPSHNYDIMDFKYELFESLYPYKTGDMVSLISKPRETCVVSRMVWNSNFNKVQYYLSNGDKHEFGPYLTRSLMRPKTKLAIFGGKDEEEGNSVISLLSILGGNNYYRHYGTDPKGYYYIDDEKNIFFEDKSAEDTKGKFTFMTIKEFYEKYPFHLGDKVSYYKKPVIITKIEWNGYKILYSFNTIEGNQTKYNTCDFSLVEKYDEDFLPLVLEPTNESKKEILYKIPDGYEATLCFGNLLKLEVKEKYPKDFNHCCQILNIAHEEFGVDGYEAESLHALQKLLIWRNAYWKHYNQWSPKNSEIRYAIKTIPDGPIYLEVVSSSHLLEFPNEDMANHFKSKEEIKDLIIKCKEFI